MGGEPGSVVLAGAGASTVSEAAFGTPYLMRIHRYTPRPLCFGFACARVSSDYDSH